MLMKLKPNCQVLIKIAPQFAEHMYTCHAITNEKHKKCPKRLKLNLDMSFCMGFPHCNVFIRNLHWFTYQPTNVSFQNRNVENAWVNSMWQHNFTKYFLPWYHRGGNVLDFLEEWQNSLCWHLLTVAHSGSCQTADLLEGLEAARAGGIGAEVDHHRRERFPRVLALDGTSLQPLDGAEQAVAGGQREGLFRSCTGHLRVA
jgi:hypothetical protein